MKPAAGFALFVAASLVGAALTYWALASARSAVSPGAFVSAEAVAPHGSAPLDLGGEAVSRDARARTLFAQDRPEGRLAAVAVLAETDTQAALDLASTFGVLERRLAIERIAVVAARRDPERALAIEPALGDPALRGLWVTRVLEAWARADAEAALAYIVAATPRDAGYGALPMDVLLAAAPDVLLAAIDRLPFIANREALRARAFESFAELDPEAAFERIAALHPVTRDDALAAVGRGLARRDAAAALAWARGLEPPSARLQAAVVSAVAERDFSAAVDLALTLPELELAQAVILEAANDGERLSVLANRLAATGDAHANWLPPVLRKWGRLDAQAAFDWLFASGIPLHQVLVADAARLLTTHDVQAAARAVDLVPAAFRGDWIAEVGRGYGRKDPAAAAVWIARFEREPRYAEWRAAVIEGAAHTDPRLALQLLADTGATPTLARTVAAAWAERDPARAAEWAVGQDARAMRMSAFAGVANVWAARDRDAFADWLLRWPADAVRDLGVAYLNDAALTRGVFDVDTLRALSSDEAREAEAVRIAARLARSDPGAARVLAARYVRDAEKRTAIERSIDNSSSP